jgi:GNAT superfamily N-acetyltransferase
MYFVQFNAPRVMSFTDPKAFDQRARKWLSIREGENNYFLGLLPEVINRGPKPGLNFFTVEEENMILAAGVCLPRRALCMSWATHEVIDTVVDFMCDAKWQIQHIHGPGHVAGYLGRLYAQRTGQRAELGRAERVYQLARNYYALPSQGHLEVATPDDRPLVREWVQGFIEEAAFEMEGRTLDSVVDALIGPRIVYLWKCPKPVSMAAWVAPTPHGASINFVYTPPECRGQGYGKAVSAALGSQMLASGLRYCFILTDVNDARTNALYQSIGARTLCEFMRCSIHPRDTETNSPLNALRNVLA